VRILSCLFRRTLFRVRLSSWGLNSQNILVIRQCTESSEKAVKTMRRFSRRSVFEGAVPVGVSKNLKELEGLVGAKTRRCRHLEGPRHCTKAATPESSSALSRRSCRRSWCRPRSVSGSSSPGESMMVTILERVLLELERDCFLRLHGPEHLLLFEPQSAAAWRRPPRGHFSS